MRGSSNKAVRVTAIMVAALGAGAVLPAACLFPDYAFDRENTGGTGGTGTSSSSSTGRGGSTSSTTTSSSSSSSGSTGGGGMGGGTGGSTTSSSSSTSSGATMCADVDCSDPKCQTDYACVSTAPTGWNGPFALYDGAPGGDPGCPAAFPTQAYGGSGQFSAAAATCTTCTCGNPTGQACQPTGAADTQTSPSYPNTIDSILVTDAACGGQSQCSGPMQVPSGWGGACYGPNGWLGGQTTCGPGSDCTNGTGACNKSVVMQPLKVAGGACTPSTESASVPPVVWGTVGDACGGAPAITKGCNANHVCLPKAQAPFQSGLCVQHDGDLSCPPVAGSPFTIKHSFYGDKSDTRDCSPCACGAPAGGSCTATVKIYSDNTVDTCSTLVTTLSVSTTAGDCKNLTGNPSTGSRQATYSPVTGGSCTPTGGQPTGSATPISPATLCCIP